MSDLNNKQWIQSIVNNENTRLHEAERVVYNNTCWPELIAQVSTGTEGHTWVRHTVWRFNYGEATNN